MKGGPTAEKEPAQRVIMTVISVCYVALLVIPAPDQRFGWSPTSTAIVMSAVVVTTYTVLGGMWSVAYTDAFQLGLVAPRETQTIRLLEQDFNREVAPLKAELRKLAGGRTPKAVAKAEPKVKAKRGRKAHAIAGPRGATTEKVRQIMRAAGSEWLATSAIREKSGYAGNLSAMLAGFMKGGSVERRGPKGKFEYRWKG